MKTKVILIAAVALVVAAFSIGAKSRSEVRPASVAPEKWIAVGDRAGFAITSEQNAAGVTTALYVRTERGWTRARVDNPVFAESLGAR